MLRKQHAVQPDLYCYPSKVKAKQVMNYSILYRDGSQALRLQ